ncbi:MAG: putative addiction module antidote protein [Candidatus Omnitrophica bacterium]|nr:putative addiction module antidote protein [Candidatus Omnitrophota bacterium]
MRKYRTLDEVEEEYFRKHPNEIDEYIEILFDEYAKDGDIQALLSSLRVISRVKGVGATAKAAGLTRNGLQKALSRGGNPKFESITAILGAMGYYLKPQKK